LSELAYKAKTDPNCWLGMKDVYGKVGDNKVFQEAFAKQLQSIHDNGVEATLAAYVQANK
jgi:mannitol 2-dehydrogenase